MSFVKQKEGGDVDWLRAEANLPDPWTPTFWRHYIYCGKCGSLNVAWTNSKEALQEIQKVGAHGIRKRSFAERLLWIVLCTGLVITSCQMVGVVSRTPELLIPYALGAGIVFFALFKYAMATMWRQKIKIYEYKCEKCGHEFSHTFPKPREDNPRGYRTPWENEMRGAFPIFVDVHNDIDDKTILGCDLRSTVEPEFLLSIGEIAGAQKKYLSGLKTRRK